MRARAGARKHLERRVSLESKKKELPIPTNPANIINNNIPLAAIVPIPALSDWGVVILVLLLVVSGIAVLRRF